MKKPVARRVFSLNVIMRFMFGLSNLFSKNQSASFLKVAEPIVASANKFSEGLVGLSDEAVRAKLEEVRTRAREAGATPEADIPLVFALVREASRRTLKQPHFDVQFIGGLALLQGKIAEMRTGEGKTLVATLPATFHALAGKGVQVVTVNDYLARRDGAWMGQVYDYFGLTVGVVTSSGAYRYDASQVVQRKHHYAIIDEVDSILIDEARTPLIISGPTGDAQTLYERFTEIVRAMKDGEDYSVD